MRRNIPTLEITQRALRASICAHCPVRPDGSESWGTEKSRACERGCRLFLNLPVLREVARQRDPMLAETSEAIVRQIQDIKESADFDGHGAKIVDGLTRQSRKVVQVFNRLFGY
jgi:hypothetical protein